MEGIFTFAFFIKFTIFCVPAFFVSKIIYSIFCRFLNKTDAGLLALPFVVLASFAVGNFLYEKYLQYFINQEKSVQQIEMKVETEQNKKILADTVLEK